MVIKLEHVGIYTDHMDRSIEFYTEVIGMKLVDRVWLGETELAFLSFPGQESVQVELIGRDPSSTQEESVVNHLALTVKDIDAVISRLKEHGYDVPDEWPQTVLDGRKIAFFKGPSGEKLELLQPAK